MQMTKKPWLCTFARSCKANTWLDLALLWGPQHPTTMMMMIMQMTEKPWLCTLARPTQRQGQHMVGSCPFMRPSSSYNDDSAHQLLSPAFLSLTSSSIGSPFYQVGVLKNTAFALLLRNFSISISYTVAELKDEEISGYSLQMKNDIVAQPFGGHRVK